MGNVAARFGPVPKTYQDLCARDPNPAEKRILAYKRTAEQAKALRVAAEPIEPKYYEAGQRAWRALWRNRPKIDQRHLLSKLWEFRGQQAEEPKYAADLRVFIEAKRAKFQAVIDCLDRGDLRTRLEHECDVQLTRLQQQLPDPRKMPPGYEDRKREALAAGVPAGLLVDILRGAGIAVRGRSRSPSPRN